MLVLRRPAPQAVEKASTTTNNNNNSNNNNNKVRLIQMSERERLPKLKENKTDKVEE
jgi:hypothetical protein